MRLLILKHVRNWSYVVLEREARANLVYRSFTRVGAGRCRMPKPWGAGALLSGRKSSSRFTKNGEIAHEKGVTDGRRMRVDTTVVETNVIIQPTQVCWAMVAVLPAR